MKTRKRVSSMLIILYLFIVIRLLEDFFYRPIITNYNERFTFLGEELDIVKSELYEVSTSSKQFIL
jgi:hypothetical protein